MRDQKVDPSASLFKPAGAGTAQRIRQKGGNFLDKSTLPSGDWTCESRQKRLAKEKEIPVGEQNSDASSLEKNMG